MEEAEKGLRYRKSAQREWNGFFRNRKRYWALLIVIPFIYFFRNRSPAIPFHHPLPPIDQLSSTDSNSTFFSPTLDRQVPPFVHYVYGLSPDFGGKPFGFIPFLCLSSALKILKPEKLFMHHVYEPTGFWWEEWKRMVAETPTELVMTKQRDITEIFGKEVTHFAHKADVIRLEVLRDYGGVYLDTDVLVLRDFTPFYKHATVMGIESQPNLDPKLPPSGLCNAVIIAKQYSSFIVRWIDTYRTFDKGLWATHSVAKPWELARQYPTEIITLNKFAFFWPLWHDDHLRLVHRTPPSRFSFQSPSSLAPTRDLPYAYHLWESLAYPRYLSTYDPDRIWNKGAKTGADREEDGASDENGFSKEVRKYVSTATRERWRAAKAKGEL